MLPKEAIEEFREIYLEETGVKLSWQEATEKSLEMLGLFKVLLKEDVKRLAKD